MKLSRQQPRGFALMFVLVVVAVATVLAFALIGSQATLAQASNNGVKAMQADALADSGLQLAVYYLQHPEQAPVLNGEGYYPGQSGISLGSGVDGTVDITVTKVAAGTFDISCTARGGSASTLTRTVAARANVVYGYQPQDAIQMNSPLSILSNMTITGNIRVNNTVSVAAGARVLGTIKAPTIVGSLLNVLGTLITPSDPNQNPVPTAVKNYKTYTYQGQTYNAELLNPNATVAGPTPTNPLGVYYAIANQSISKNLTVNGTLLTEGAVKINANLTIVAPRGMPALVTNGDFKVAGSNRQISITGLTHLKGNVAKDGLLGGNNKVELIGAVQISGTTAVHSSYSGTINITYDPDKAIVPGIVAGADNATYSVKLTSFSSSSATASTD